MRRKRRFNLDYVEGSVRKGGITFVGESRVIVAAREGRWKGACWHMGAQSREAYDTGYLVMHDSRCYKLADVNRLRKSLR
jgi:hypothetical protein